MVDLQGNEEQPEREREEMQVVSGRMEGWEGARRGRERY